jgi:DNA-binding NtrC family response regulator
MYMGNISLSNPERTFLQRVSRSIFANPFSDERANADVELADITAFMPYEERIRKVIESVGAKINRLIADGKDDITRFSGQDRMLIENGFLFHIYHQFYESFGTLIFEQINAGDAPQRVTFARKAISMITSRGFSSAEALHYFAIFFQMRRAFYFINRSIIGSSPCMKELRLNLWNNVFTRDINLYARYLWNRMEDYSTLLLGDTGTGKGISAAAIGRSGYIPFDEKKECFRESFTSAFVSLNLSQFPEQLIESELFGHKKGAFTGAVADHDGVFSRCSSHGAIFLDEIGEVSVPLQVKLLQVLQERVFSPVGSHEKKRFSGRVIAATNRTLGEIRTGKIIRDDFFYRLCSDVNTVPPLRMRIREDANELDYLITHTLDRIVGEHSPELAAGVRETIQKQVPPHYAWPGNVRELEQCLRRILLKQSYEIEPVGTTAEDTAGQLSEGIKEGSLNAQQLLSGYCKIIYDKFGTYEAVAKRTGLDRRTAKKYVDMWEG